MGCPPTREILIITVFFWYFPPPSLCCAMAVKCQQFCMFSLILINLNSSCFGVSFKDHLLGQTLFGRSCKRKWNIRYLLQTKRGRYSSDFGSLNGESLGAIRIMTKLTSGQVKCSGKMKRMGALWPGSAGFESHLCHLAACTSSLTWHSGSLSVSGDLQISPSLSPMDPWDNVCKIPVCRGLMHMRHSKYFFLFFLLLKHSHWSEAGARVINSLIREKWQQC